MKRRGYVIPEDVREAAHDVLRHRIGLTYELTRQVSLYTVYGQSFTPELFATDINGDLLDPETGEIYELGAKSEWLGGRLGINTALYRVDRENVAVSADVPPGTAPYSITSGLQRSEGVEIEVMGRPLPGWDLSLAWNVVDSQFKDRRDPFFGQQPGGTADWQVGAYTAYELQSGAAKGLGFGATVYAISV